MPPDPHGGLRVLALYFQPGEPTLRSQATCPKPPSWDVNSELPTPRPRLRPNPTAASPDVCSVQPQGHEKHTHTAVHTEPHMRGPQTPQSLVTGSTGLTILFLFLSRYPRLSCSVMSDSCDPMDCSPTGSSAHGISQAGILEWVAISYPGGSSQPRDQTRGSCIGRRTLYH